MKYSFPVIVGLAGLYLAGNFAPLQAQPTNAPALERVGIYDSRAVAYAHFWSEPCQKKLKDLIAAAKAAKESGDTNKFTALASALRDAQANNHRQVFSTASVEEALAEIAPKLSKIQKQAGVSTLISKWDTEKLKQHPNVKTVDVTDQMVREFLTPNPQQKKTLQSIRQAKPVPLEECNELIRKGKI